MPNEQDTITQVHTPASTAVAPDPLASTMLTADPPTESDLQRGALVGRYVVLERIGQGGMGVVHSAYDPELDRKIALKLWLAGGERGGGAQLRMLREAQAMAKLSHPAVVAVHDVGTLGARVWIAMEFVEGQTLARWLRERPRSPREVLLMFSRAGEGLAAAHDAGLIHRDFKTDNVMVGSDGRVRVLDFGLARAEVPGARTTPESLAGIQATGALDASLTVAGALLGTPRYMAPEQWEGAPGDARIDQFSFCVALWEALFGAPPFEGATLPELALAVLAGRITQGPIRTRVPTTLRRALLRGLALAPDRRWPTMAALLQALRRTPSKRSRALVLGGAAGMLLGVVLGARELVAARTEAKCLAEAGALASVWNEEERLRLRTLLPPGGADTSTWTIDRIDRHAAAWAAARHEVCVGEVGSDPSNRARITTCLDELHDGLAELLALLPKAAPRLATRVALAAASLPAPAQCLDPRRLGPYEPTAPEHANATAEIRRALGKATAHLAAGEYSVAQVVSEAALHAASTLAVPVLLARAQLTAGVAAEKLGDYQAAHTYLEDAFFTASTVHADEVAGDAASWLVWVDGALLQRPREGLVWARLAELSLARQSADEHDLRRSSLLNNLGALYYERNDYTAAEAAYQRALVISAPALGPEHPDNALTLSNLGAAQKDLGEFAAAEASFLRAIAVLAATLGHEHPDLMPPLVNLGRLYALQKNDAAALRYYQKALELGERALGPEHSELPPVLIGLAYLHYRRGALAEARRELTRALAITERTNGPNHPKVADVLVNLADVETYKGGATAAVEYARRALAIRETSFGPRDKTVADALNILASALKTTGDTRAALPLFVRAADIYAETLPPGHLDRVSGLRTLGETQHILGDAAAAVATLEQAQAQAAAPDFDRNDRAAVAFALAKALHANKGPRPRIVALAEAARADYEAVSSTDPDAVEVRTWLAKLR